MTSQPNRRKRPRKFVERENSDKWCVQVGRYSTALGGAVHAHSPNRTQVKSDVQTANKLWQVVTNPSRRPCDALALLSVEKFSHRLQLQRFVSQPTVLLSLDILLCCTIRTYLIFVADVVHTYTANLLSLEKGNFKKYLLNCS